MQKCCVKGCEETENLRPNSFSQQRGNPENGTTAVTASGPETLVCEKHAAMFEAGTIGSLADEEETPQ